jgi:fructosamine-3-kinase
MQNRFKSFNYSEYGVSHKEYFQPLLANFKGEYKIIHGDLVFSNIILTNNGHLKFIDVKGKQGDKLSIFGDKFYDYGKIYQSLIGYDEILLDKDIKRSYKNKMIKHFESQFTDQEMSRIKSTTKSLLLTLLPLHNEPHKFSKYIELSKKIL